MATNSSTAAAAVSIDSDLSNSFKNWGGYDHVHLYVSNAKQAADWYVLRFGFVHVAYRGLETTNTNSNYTDNYSNSNRDVATHVIRQNDIYLAFSSPLNPSAANSEIAQRIALRGDGVKDVAFRVRHCEAIYTKAMSRGAVSVSAPVTHTDEHGSVVMATIRTYGDVVHTFVERLNYSGCFLPHFRASSSTVDPLSALAAAPKLMFIDHVVGNQPDGMMEDACKFYEHVLGFTRFWTADDKQIHSEYSSLRSVVMADSDNNSSSNSSNSSSRTIKMPINEPADGIRKSQITEFCNYNSGAGVQHIALNTNNIIDTVKALRARGVQFLTVPASYYTDVRQRLKVMEEETKTAAAAAVATGTTATTTATVVVKESLDELERLHILIDFDATGYLLQLFTKPTQDRPTLFYECIQRCGHEGFGAGNFKALFEAIEREQEKRGNL